MLNLEDIKYNNAGLVPVIAQQYDTKEVLMMAWMNEEAIKETLETSRACYFSRSRNKLWRKGESSGQFQELKEFKVDCDNDTILILVNQKGVACHTGRRTCFYKKYESGKFIESEKVLIDPKSLYK